MEGFSVIIPLYNKALSVGDTIRSVLRQSFPSFELIIVDDGSTDDSINVVKSFKDNRIVLYKRGHRGVSAARNFGIGVSKFGFLAFLDADDIWEVNYLLSQKMMVERFPAASIWGSAWGYLYKTEGKHIVRRQMLKGKPHYVENYWSMNKWSNLFFLSATIVKKEVIKRVSNFDVRMRYGEDLDFVYRVLLDSVSAYNPLKCNVWYVQDSENRSQDGELPPLKYCLPFFVDKFKIARFSNVHFMRFLDKTCIGILVPYLRCNNLKERHLARLLLDKLNLKRQGIVTRLYVRFPFVSQPFVCFVSCVKMIFNRIRYVGVGNYSSI